MNILQPLNRLGRFKKPFLWVIIILAAYTLLGFLILPFTIKLIAVKKLSQAFGRPVSIGSVKLNPYAVSLTVEKLTIQERQEQADFVAFNKLYANLSTSSILKLAPVVEELRLDGPYVRVVRTGENAFNFSDIISPREPETKPAPPPEASEPLKFSVNNIQISNGRAEIHDRLTDKVHTINKLNFDIPFISNIGTDVEIFTQPRFTAEINKTPVNLTGQTKPFHDSLESTLSINLKGIDLPYYFAYVPVKTSIDVTSGTLDVAAELTFTRYKDKEPQSQVTGDVIIRDLGIMDAAKNQLLKLALLQIAVAPSSLLAGKVHLGKILLEGTDIGIARDQNGKVNIYNVVAAEEPAQPPPAAESTQKKPFDLMVDEIVLKDARVSVSDSYKAETGAAAAQVDLLKLPSLSVSGISLDAAQQDVVVEAIAAEGCSLFIKRIPGGDLTVQAIAQPETAAEQQAPPAPGGTAWVATVKKISLQGCSFEGEQLTAEEESNLTLDGITLDARDVSTRAAAKSQIDFSCRVNKAGTVAAKGDCCLTPLSANLNLDVKKIDMAEFQPFFEGVMNATLASGSLSAAGTLKLSQEQEAMATSFTGDSAIADFAMKEKNTATDLLQWKQLTVAGIDVGTSPLSISIKDITLEKLFSNIVVNQDKTVNLANSMTPEHPSPQPPAKGEAQEPPEPQKTEPLPLTIGVIALKDGKINLTDRSVMPAYSASITSLNGTIRNISPKQEQKADVLLTASINNSAPVKITGTLNPFRDALFLDLAVKLNDMDLSPFTPYSGKYVGHRIQKGKLSLDLHYLIDDKKLDSTNDIIIDQFDFGEKVESPDAVDLPVKLGVSLLKDSSGKIKLNLPISGRLDNPEFSIVGVLVKVLKNLLLKAATSPFSLLGSMMGSSEDLSHAAFEQGSTLLSDAEQAKLATLAKALADRPALSIEIAGFVDVEADRQGLVDAAFEQQLLAQESKKKAAKDQAAASLTEIAPEEYEKLLSKAYRSAKFEKPKALLGVAKSLPAEEMESLLKKNISITDDDLRALAKGRAGAVMDYLSGQGQVAAGRLFLAESSALTAEKKENVPDSRVDLRIR